MKKNYIFILLFFLSELALGQSVLYVPGGRTAILTSTTNGIGVNTSTPDGMFEFKSPNSSNTLKIGYSANNPHHISTNVPMVFNSADASFYFRKITSGFDPGSFQNLMVLTSNPSTLLMLNGAMNMKSTFSVGDYDVNQNISRIQTVLSQNANYVRTAFSSNASWDGTNWIVNGNIGGTDAGAMIYTGDGWAFVTHATTSSPVSHTNFMNGTRMFVAATGNVIIGDKNSTMINDPNHKLLVNGKIKAKGVKVDANGWADYVFAPNFKLRPLTEVATFIKENKHLPDVPSEKEVQENGIDVTEMQKIQMQKIEELYLYMIEMKKENEELKKQNEELQKEIEKLKKKKIR